MTGFGKSKVLSNRVSFYYYTKYPKSDSQKFDGKVEVYNYKIIFTKVMIDFTR